MHETCAMCNRSNIINSKGLPLLMVAITFCFDRHILACLHFNENVRRDTVKRKDGQKYIKVSYPKHKLGDEVVREVAVPATYSECKMSSSGPRTKLGLNFFTIFLIKTCMFCNLQEMCTKDCNKITVQYLQSEFIHFRLCICN